MVTHLFRIPAASTSGTQTIHRTPFCVNQYVVAERPCHRGEATFLF